MNEMTNGKPTPTAQLQLQTSFKYENEQYFTLFCVPHMIKTARNALFIKGNDFNYPELKLSIGYVLQAGICSMKYIRDLYHKNKDKLICNYRMSKNVACTDNLNKQKVPPALALFCNELTTAL